MTPAERLQVALYASGWAALRHVPHRGALAAGRLGADAALARGAGARLRRNLARATGLQGPALDRLVRDGLRSYARYWVEAFRLPVLPAAQVVRGTRAVGAENLDAARARGRGVVLALPHTGNWDAAGAWLVATRTPFTTVAERLRPEALFERFVAFREALGMEVLALTGGEGPPTALLAERLRAGGVLCLLADRDLTDRGVPVSYLGGPGRAAAGPAVLARRTGAVLLPVTLSFTDAGTPGTDPHGWEIRLHPPVVPGPAEQMTQDLLDVFAAAVLARPQDWHLLGRVWTDEAGGRPS